MAALSAAGVASSMADAVFSVNMVGYINLTIPKNFSLIGNQLNNTPDNKIGTLFPAPPDGTFIYKFDPLTGYSSESYDAGLAVWSGGGNLTMNPGEGAFVFAKTAFVATFVGEVQLSSTLSFPAGSFSIGSSVIPQAGALHDPVALGHTDLQYGVPADKEFIYLFSNTLGYSTFGWDGGLGGWGGDPNAAGPQLNVGDAFFHFAPLAAGAHTWTRTFAVGP
jgi:hypothetical protein